MKKIIGLMITVVMVFSLVACTNQSESTENRKEENLQQESSQQNASDDEKNSQSNDNKENESESVDAIETNGSLEILGQNVDKYVEDTIVTLNTSWEKLKTEVDTYENYLKNTDKVKAFYGEVYNETNDLCIKMREYAVDFAEEIMASDKSNDDKYDDLDELYDCIYDGAGDEVYDEIYDGTLDDMYEVFYDGILDEAYDDAPYEEWSGARSDEYEWWSDTRSDVYEEWSDARSEIYEFWSDLRSELWDDDTEKAEKIIEEFKEDIEKLKAEE